MDGMFVGDAGPPRGGDGDGGDEHGTGWVDPREAPDADPYDGDRDGDVWADLEPIEPRFHDGMPIAGYLGGEPIPHLGRLPRERWRASLEPLMHRTRRRAVSTVRSPEDASVALALVGELELDDGAAVERAQSAPPPRLPAGALPATASSRQVNFRLGPREYARLERAAELFAARPTTLARMLTVRGVDRVLYEERRDK